jgi:dCTP deaminase
MPQFGRTKVLKAAALISSDHLGRAIAPSFSFITMTLLNDKQIAKLAENDIFLPFVGEKRRELDNGTKAISFGLSQAGYDIRLSSVEFLVFDQLPFETDEKVIDAKNFNLKPEVAELHEQEDGSAYFMLPPLSYGVGTSLELISMPNNVFALCEGKSTYGRCGLIANILPIEPGWAGYLTMCLVNPTSFPIRLYANEGIAQLVLFGIEEVGEAYSGAYQNQGARVQLAAV